MGTGGGEFLSGLREALPRRTVATEEWDVNAPLASRRLAPLGADVVRCKSVRLPFVDGAFDVVVNRHEELDPAEVARVLSSNGLLITQQVGRHDWQELRRFIPRMTDWGDLRGRYTAALESLGFRVKSQESERKVAYASLGAFVFMLCIAPWTIPNFDVEQDLDALLGLEAECTTDKGLVLTECRFLITAEKMNESTAMSQ